MWTYKKDRLIFVVSILVFLIERTNAKYLQYTKQMRASTGYILDVAISHDQKFMVTVDYQKKVKIWNYTTFQLIKTFTFGSVGNFLKIHPKDNRIFFKQIYGPTYVIDGRNFTQIAAIPACTSQNDGNTNIAFSSSIDLFSIWNFYIVCEYNSTTYQIIQQIMSNIRPFTLLDSWQIPSIAKTFVAGFTQGSAQIYIVDLQQKSIIFHNTSLTGCNFATFSRVSGKYFIVYDGIQVSIYTFNSSLSTYEYAYSSSLSFWNSLFLIPISLSNQFFVVGDLYNNLKLMQIKEQKVQQVQRVCVNYNQGCPYYILSPNPFPIPGYQKRISVLFQMNGVIAVGKMDGSVQFYNYKLKSIQVTEGSQQQDTTFLIMGSVVGLFVLILLIVIFVCWYRHKCYRRLSDSDSDKVQNQQSVATVIYNTYISRKGINTVKIMNQSFAQNQEKMNNLSMSIMNNNLSTNNLKVQSSSDKYQQKFEVAEIRKQTDKNQSEPLQKQKQKQKQETSAIIIQEPLKNSRRIKKKKLQPLPYPLISKLPFYQQKIINSLQFKQKLEQVHVHDINQNQQKQF